jgi:NAD(P)-dependent dehydrogenase (short-subunit alcohol dehydrogenase family)
MTNMAVCLSKDVAGSGVTANAVSPGMVLTEGVVTWLDALAKQTVWPADLATIEKRVTSEFVPVPVGRLGRVDEIGAMVVWLASPLGAIHQRREHSRRRRHRADGQLVTAMPYKPLGPLRPSIIS